MKIIRRNSWLAACVVLVVESTAVAIEPPDLQNNPFARPPMVVLPRSSGATGKNTESAARLQLTATMVSGNTRFASINGRIMKEGDSVIDYELKRIFEDRVLFIRNDVEVIVYVKPQRNERNEQNVANR